MTDNRKKDRRRDHYVANREKQLAAATKWNRENSERVSAANKARRLANPHVHTARDLVQKARARARVAGREFDAEHITVERIEKQLRHNLGCDCCGGEMLVGPKPQMGPALNSPTLDRINTHLGYVRGNVALICWRCNRLKSDASSDELRMIANWMDRRAL